MSTDPASCSDYPNSLQLAATAVVAASAVSTVAVVAAQSTNRGSYQSSGNPSMLRTPANPVSSLSSASIYTPTPESRARNDVATISIEITWKDNSGSMQLAIEFRLNPEFWSANTCHAGLFLMFKATCAGQNIRSAHSNPRGKFEPERSSILWDFGKLEVDCTAARRVEAIFRGDSIQPGRIQVKWETRYNNDPKNGIWDRVGLRHLGSTLIIPDQEARICCGQACHSTR